MQKQIYSKRLLSLFLVFVMALSLMTPAYAAEYETAYGDSLVQPIADPIITLSTTKSVYTLEETASITVQTSEGATVYYTTDGSTPDSSGANAQTVNDGKISVSAPDRGTYPDGGIITVKAIAVVDGDVSEVDEVAISFYRASENASTDVFSLETNTGTYYFSGFLTAIDAGGDANLAGPMVLKLLKTTTESYSAGNKTSIFSQATGGLEIDLNGFDWTLDCSSVKSTYFIFAANVTITDSTATGTATDNSLTAGQWTLINGKFTVNQNGIIENVKLKQTTGGEKSTTSTSVQINGNTILSKKIKANGIIWLVIAILQSLLGLIYLFSGFVWVNILYGIALIIVAIINFYSSYTNFYYSRSIINYPCGIVSNFRPIGGYIANLIYNIIFGGIFGIIGSIYGFTVRSYVLNNEIYFLDLEDNYLKCKKSENRFANLNQWQCSKCGKVNENYVGTCGCGNTKANSINR